MPLVIRKLIKKTLLSLNVDVPKMVERIGFFSLKMSLREQKLEPMVESLRKIIPDVSEQESHESGPISAYFELKRRQFQAFQCRFVLESLKQVKKPAITVVDVGDSSGAHMVYMRELTKGKLNLRTISVNLDPRAIEKIRKRGLEAVLSRAEHLSLDAPVDLFTSFEMVEHLHDPALFFHRLAMRNDESLFLMTVPYVKISRVGLHHVRGKLMKKIYAEDEHIFELNPEDWSLLLKHSGWKVLAKAVYYQYPRRLFLLSWLLAGFWRITDYEGFWVVLLTRDKTFADLYQDWES